MQSEREESRGRRAQRLFRLAFRLAEENVERLDVADAGQDARGRVAQSPIRTEQHPDDVARPNAFG